MNPKLVAEVSSNHHADLERCLRFVDATAELCLWGVKFQQFRVRQLFAPEALRHAPDLLEREAWELPEGFNPEIAARARSRGVCFGSTPFYLSAVDALEPYVDFFKVASYQLLWHELLREVARAKKPVVLATGMGTLEEVRAAVDVLGEAGCPELTVLHCVSLYPTPGEKANLAAIETLRRALALPVGWSDHTVDPALVRRAVRHHGAEMVEFHLDLDGDGEEFGGGHCWLPDDVRRLQRLLRTPEPEPPFAVSDGDGLKAPHMDEGHERGWRTDPSDGLRPLLRVRAELSRGPRQP